MKSFKFLFNRKNHKNKNFRFPFYKNPRLNFRVFDEKATEQIFEFSCNKRITEKSQIFIRRGKNYKYKNYEYSFCKRVTEKILNFRLTKKKS